MPLHTLNTIKIAKLLRDGSAGHHADGGNLYLQVTVGKTGTVTGSWIFRYQRLGRTRDMGLGALADVTLAIARVLAATARETLRAGNDPIAARDAAEMQKRLEAAHTITFEKAAKVYLEAHAANWRNHAHRLQWKTSLKAYAEPVLGALSLRDIDTALVLKVIEPLWSTKPETGNRVRRRIEKVLDWGRAKGFRAGENPARWKGHIDQLLPARRKVRKIVHHPALNYCDMAEFMAALQKQSGTDALALEFIVLTSARTGDLVGNSKNDKPAMQWTHVDFGNAIWTVPSAKGDREHRIPLSAAALDLLETIRAQKRDDVLVFP